MHEKKLVDEIFVFFPSGFSFTNIYDSRIGQQGKGEVVSLTHLYYFHPLPTPTDTETLAERLLKRAHFETGTFGFRVQVVNH